MTKAGIHACAPSHHSKNPDRPGASSLIMLLDTIQMPDSGIIVLIFLVVGKEARVFGSKKENDTFSKNGRLVDDFTRYNPGRWLAAAAGDC
jgi:hypothetical protein